MPRYYPLPNRPGTVSNYFTNQLRPYDYNAGMGRVDHNFTDTNRLFVTTYWNKRQEDRYNWAQDAANATDGGVINGFEITKGFDYRTNTGTTGGFTSALSLESAARHPRELVAFWRVSGSGGRLRSVVARVLAGGAAR